MGLYRRIVLPWLIDGAMAAARLTPYRAALVADLAGDVLEIGIGSGHNLNLYRRDRVRLAAVEPDAVLRARAGRLAARLGWQVDLCPGTAEALPHPDGSFDWVVSSWTLCSIRDPALALAEIRRVLRPGGGFRLVEHGLAPEPGVASWQRRLTPCQRLLAGGCHLDRPIDRLVAAAGFDVTGIETGYMPGPKLAGYLYSGTAWPDQCRSR